VQGASAGLAMGLAALVAAGVPAPSSLLLVGGGAQHPTWRHAVADACGLTVGCPPAAEYAARGMAAQARAVLDGLPVAEVGEAWRPPASDLVAPRAGRGPSLGHQQFLDSVRGIWEGT
jgi:sugar (pentulose or hexulose) kinase